MLANRVESWFEEWKQQGLEEGRAKGLEQGLEQGLKQGLEQGLQKGRAEGLTAMLEKQLRLKFNDLDGPLIQRLYNASPEELDCWAERVLFASTLEEVFQ